MPTFSEVSPTPTYIEVMLLENFGSAYLDSTAHKIEDYSYQYRELYTKCYNQIEGYAKTSINFYFLSWEVWWKTRKARYSRVSNTWLRIGRRGDAYQV